MKKRELFIVLCLGAIVGSGITIISSKYQRKIACQSKSGVALQTTLRKLWEDHITWTRNYIISDLANLEDKAEVTQRLLKNQDDLGAAIATVYGDPAGKEAAKLLREHILIAAEVVTAAKNNNTTDLEKSSKKWRDNANDLAQFLHKANPDYWPLDAVKDMLYQHLDFTTGEVVSRLKKDWKADIAFYDKGHDHMLMLADIMADGMQKQFPKKFN